jgi:hypothetical protein
MSILNTVANLLPETSRTMVVRVVEFVCGQPVPDDAAPLSRRVKDMTGSKRDSGEADPLNLAAAGRASQPEGSGEPHQFARPDTYDENVALWQRFEEELQRPKRSLDVYEYGAMMAATELRQRGRTAITLSDAELFGRD